MRSPVQIRIAAPKTPENLGFWGFFVAKSCFTVRVKNPDPHRDTHAETAGKDKRAPDGKICLPVRFLRLLKRLYNLSQDAAHSLGGLVLLLPRGVGVGALGCCVLLCALDNFFILFFDARMGFVWVSCRTHTARPHPFICTFCLQAVKICDILSMALHKSAGG